MMRQQRQGVFGDLRVRLIDIDVDARRAHVFDQRRDIGPTTWLQCNASLRHFALQAHMNGNISSRQDGSGLLGAKPVLVP